MNNSNLGPPTPSLLVRILMSDPIFYSLLGKDYVAEWKIFWADLEMIAGFVRKVIAVAIRCGSDDLQQVRIHSPSDQSCVYVGCGVLLDDPVHNLTPDQIDNCKTALAFALQSLFMQQNLHQRPESSVDRDSSSSIEELAYEFKRNHPNKKFSTPIIVEIFGDQFFVSGSCSNASPSKPIETIVDILTGRVDGVGVSDKSFRFLQDSGPILITFNPDFALRKLCDRLASQEQTTVSILRAMGGDAKIQAILKEILDGPPTWA